MAQSTTPMHLDRIVGVSREGEWNLFELLFNFLFSRDLVGSCYLFVY